MTLLYNVKLKNVYGIQSAKVSMKIWVGIKSKDHESTIKAEIKKQWGDFAELDSYSPAKENGRQDIGIGRSYGPGDR